MIKILKVIKSILYAYESNSYPFLAVRQATKSFYASYHQTTTSCDYYMESIKNISDGIVHCGRSLGDHPLLVNKTRKGVGVEPPSANDQQVETAKTEAK